MSEVARSVRGQFRSEYECRDVTVQARRHAATGQDAYLATGCGRTVEYVCETTTRQGFAVNGGTPPVNRDTFCSKREQTGGTTGWSSRPRERGERTRAARVTDAEHGVTYIGLTLASSWWEVRFIAPEAEGRATGEVVVVLRAATASSLLQRCGDLAITTEAETSRLTPTEAATEGRVKQYRTTLDVIRTVATADQIRIEGCNVSHPLSEAERSDLRQLVLLATPRAP